MFFLEPWRSIYQTDGERIMLFDDTVWFSEALKGLYGRSGYTLVEVPAARWRTGPPSFAR